MQELQFNNFAFNKLVNFVCNICFVNFLVLLLLSVIVMERPAGLVKVVF
jgi:hypothetical protein